MKFSSVHLPVSATFAALFAACACAWTAPAELRSAEEKFSLAEKVKAREAELDAIYTPDGFDPPIPFSPEKKPNADVAAKRAAYKTKLRTVSKFKEKANPEEIDKWFAKIMPTLDDPLALSINAELRKEIAEKMRTYRSVPAREVYPHPSARFFPGDVPETFRRVSKALYSDPDREGWQCSGLYAAPGERVRVHVSKSAVGSGLRIRIGSHTDDLLESRQRYWRRFPGVTREFGVGEQSFEIANAFGGLIYVSVPRGRATKRTQITFSGVVEAPFFSLGETKPAQWEAVRYSPAPWAEFEGKNFVAVIPADEAAAIDDPAQIIRFWDEIVAELDRIVAGPKERRRTMRFVTDAETTAAAGHSGAPIAGNLLWSRSYWDMERIRRDGAWELFFAIARNVVGDAWTFEGDKDTPAALLALYCMERATGRKASTFFDVPALQAACFARIKRREEEEKNPKALREKLRQEELESKEERKKILSDKASKAGRREREKKADEADTEDFRHDPGVPYQRLSAYIPVVEETGWEPLAKTFKAYTVRNRLPLSGDEEKRRTFVMLWSQATKKNLSPYFEHFGFPRQNGAGNYPVFMPENFPPDASLRPKAGGTGYLGVSLFPTIAVLNANYRVPQLPRPEKSGSGTPASPFGILDDEDDGIKEDFDAAEEEALPETDEAPNDDEQT